MPPTSNSKIIGGTTIEPVKKLMKKKKGNLPRTPPLYDAGKESLLGIVSDIWPKTVNDLSKVTVKASQNFRNYHPRLECFKNFGE